MISENPMDSKLCKKCNTVKSVTEFHKSKRHMNGIKNECAKCTNEYLRKHYIKNKSRYNQRSQEAHYLRKYNLKYSEYLDLCEKVNYQCEICFKSGEPAKSGRGKKSINNVLVVDHDHNTGQVRGILCQDCNRGLGLFKDNAKVLIKASEYVLKDKEK